MTRFNHLPANPKADCCIRACTVLSDAHDAATSFLIAFETIRNARRATGTPTDEEQDLLRAMLCFACSGLDCTVQYLFRDALPVVAAKSEGCKAFLQGALRKELQKEKDGTVNWDVLLGVLFATSAHDHIVSRIVEKTTGESLQSAEQLMRAAACFDIKSDQIVSDKKTLQEVFDSRNRMMHDMDVDFTQKNRNRRPRRKTAMIDATNLIFHTAGQFLSEVDKRACA